MASVELKQVAMSYDGKRQVICGNNLEIQHGTSVVFDRHSGRGRSLPLHMIAGREGITNRDTLAFQEYALHLHKTLRGNRIFELRLHKTPEDEIGLRETDAAQLLPIAQMLARKPALPSGGRCQRAAISRASSDSFLLR